MTDDGLPEGWRIVLADDTRRTNSGRVLMGGRPFRVMALTDAGMKHLDSGAVSTSRAWRRLARRLVDGGLATACPPADVTVDPFDVAVVVPVRDDVAGARGTLASLGPVGETIVVDDGSREPLGPATLRHERPLGPAAARQRGWLATGKPFIAFVDADVRLPDGWLPPLLAHFADPQIAAVAPRVATSPGRRLLDRYDASRSPLDLGPVAGSIRPLSRVPYVPTAVLVARRSALVEVGGFDLTRRVGEDIDLEWRLHERGWRLRYEPTVVAHHPARPTFGAWLRQRFTYGTSAAPLASRHGTLVAPLHVSEWSALVWLALLLRRPVLALGVVVATTVALRRRLGFLEQPWRETARITVGGHLAAGRLVSDGLRRPWWPVLALLVAHRRTRMAAALIAVVPPLLDWCRLPSEVDPLRYLGLRAIDDVAYGTGVLLGCARERSLRALLPRFTGRNR